MVKFRMCMIRSYDPEYTPSRPIWEVKQDSARPVLRTEMTREALVTNLLPPFCAIRLLRRDFSRNRREKRATEAVFGAPSPAAGHQGVTPRAPVRVALPFSPLSQTVSFNRICVSNETAVHHLSCSIAAPEGYELWLHLGFSQCGRGQWHLRYSSSVPHLIDRHKKVTT